MPSINAGLVDDLDILQNERVIDMDEVIKYLDEDNSIFTTMLMKVASKDAFSSTVEWLEDELFPTVTTLAASALSTAGTMDVASGTGAYFRIQDVARITSSGEAIAVSAAPSTDTVGITRSVGSVAAATAASGVEVIIIGNAAAQGATLGTRAVTERTRNFNYTQIFRHPYGFTNTLAASKLYGGPEPQKERRKKGIEHKRALELSLFGGPRELVTSGSEPRGYMGGLREFVTTNVHDPSGAMTKAEWETFMIADLQYGEDKVAFVSPMVASVLSQYLADNWVHATPDETRWGVKVRSYISGAYGDSLPVFVHRDWARYSTALNSLGGTAWIVDMSSVTLRPLRRTVLLRNRQANDADEQTEEYLTETSFQVEQERKHARIGGVTAAA